MCQEGAWLAASSIMRVSYGASHGIGHVLGGLCGVPYGHTSCILLPHVMRWNLEATKSRQALISQVLGEPETPAADLIARLIAGLGQPTTLRDAGMPEERLGQISEMAMDNLFVKTNPRPLQSPDDARAILDAAW